MSKLLDQELQELEQRIEIMAHSVRQSLGASVDALLGAHEEAVRIISDGDQEINEQRHALERDVVALIALHQPVARDVRLVVGILEIATELERMGDYSKDISRIANRQAPHGPPTPPAGIVRMAEHAEGMLERAVTAFLGRDVQLASAVVAEDDEINELCATLHRRLLQQAHSNDAELEEAVRLLPAVHNIERFADRITNICERTIYVMTGDQVEYDDRRD